MGELSSLQLGWLFLHGWSSKCSLILSIPGRSWNMTACPAFCRKIMCVDSGIWPGLVKGDLSLGPVNFSKKSTQTSLGVSESGVKVNLSDRGDPKPTLDLNLILILPICFEHTWKTWVDDTLMTEIVNSPSISMYSIWQCLRIQCTVASSHTSHTPLLVVLVKSIHWDPVWWRWQCPWWALRCRAPWRPKDVSLASLQATCSWDQTTNKG